MRGGTVFLSGPELVSHLAKGRKAVNGSTTCEGLRFCMFIITIIKRELLFTVEMQNEWMRMQSGP